MYLHFMNWPVKVVPDASSTGAYLASWGKAEAGRGPRQAASSAGSAVAAAPDLTTR
jgi:hypothetical protein